MTIQAVTFDVGGTLIAPWPSVGEVYLRAARGFADQVQEAKTVTARFQRIWTEETERFDYSDEAWFRLVRASLGECVAESQWPALFQTICAQFEEPSAWRVFPEVRTTLAGLKRGGVCLGVLSNWDRRLRPLLAALELTEYFDEIVVSAEVGCQKPSPEVFKRAAAGLGAAPDRILHVGDSWREDWKGARDAGFQARWLRREGGASSPEQIHTLEVLLSLPDIRSGGDRTAQSQRSDAPSDRCVSREGA